MLRLSGLITVLTGLLSGETTATVPVGLWQNQEEGFVIRIEACGQGGLCGFAAGASKDKKRKANPEEVCGQQMLKEFRWNEKGKRWEGTMQPPGTSMKMTAWVTSDGKSFFTMKGKVLLMSKTMNFVPFAGEIGEGCRVL